MLEKRRSMSGRQGGCGKDAQEKEKKRERRGAPLMAGAVGRWDSERMFHVKHFWMTGPDGASAGGGLAARAPHCCRNAGKSALGE